MIWMGVKVGARATSVVRLAFLWVAACAVFRAVGPVGAIYLSVVGGEGGVAVVAAVVVFWEDSNKEHQ